MGKRLADRLSATEVKNAKPSKAWPELLPDGKNLYLQVSPNGTKCWIFRYAIRGKTRDMGLGGYPEVSLAKARELRDQQRKVLKEQGLDPLAARDAMAQEAARALAAQEIEEARRMTFAQAASAYMDAKVDLDEGGFKNPKHRQQWRNTIETYANPVIGHISIADIDTDYVLRVLQQDSKDRAGNTVGTLWNTKTETASRLRGRIEAVLSWAAFRGLRAQGDNPARWKGHLDNELTARNDISKPKHHAALPYAEVGVFMDNLRKREGSAARALEFSILTAARSSEVRLAARDEIDLEAKVWTIPAERMKAGKEHRVALSDEAIALLKSLPREDGNPLLFIGTAKTGGLSENAMNNLLGRMGRSDLTQHGFRSSFRDWAGETTAHPREVIEHALAHRLKDKAEAAYARGTLMAKRARLMADWGRYCGIVQPKDGAGDTVVPMRSGAV